MKRFKKRSRLLRAQQTSAESKLWCVLRNRQLARWKFRRRHRIDRYIVDFVTLDGKLIVEVDGATHSAARELTYDAKRTQLLTSFGFHVVRVTNTDVYENIEGVQEMIASTLNSLCRVWPPHPRAARAISPHRGELGCSV
ncbi:MAG TPA: endonuclease domain-containing protein [Xanthobacteraceae bacterium]|nr:endonuclease domain-containing protein [Xanthobacteraceae bacterium]